MSEDGRWFVVLFTTFILASGWTVSAWPQEGGVVLTPSGQVTTGRLEYRRYCASCHGLSGKGTGPAATSLKEKPTDLTMLSKNNGGTFPSKHVYDVISGAEVVAAHGTREMPIWGIQMRQSPSAVLGAGGPKVRSPRRVKNEIDMIVHYIESIQVK